MANEAFHRSRAPGGSGSARQQPVAQRVLFSMASVVAPFVTLQAVPRHPSGSRARDAHELMLSLKRSSAVACTPTRPEPKGPAGAITEEYV